MKRIFIKLCLSILAVGLVAGCNNKSYAAETVANGQVHLNFVDESIESNPFIYKDYLINLRDYIAYSFSNKYIFFHDSASIADINSYNKDLMQAMDDKALEKDYRTLTNLIKVSNYIEFEQNRTPILYGLQKSDSEVYKETKTRTAMLYLAILLNNKMLTNSLNKKWIFNSKTINANSAKEVAKVEKMFDSMVLTNDDLVNVITNNYNLMKNYLDHLQKSSPTYLLTVNSSIAHDLVKLRLSQMKESDQMFYTVKTQFRYVITAKENATNNHYIYK